MMWNRRLRRIFNMTLFTAIALVLAGQSRADAATVLLLSTGNAATDTTIKTGLEGRGHQVTVGPQYTAFVGADLSTHDVVVLVPNHNFSAGDMPPAGQLALTAFIRSGIGLDQIRHFSRHKTLATMLIYRDEHDKAATQRTLADVVSSTLTSSVA